MRPEDALYADLEIRILARRDGGYPVEITFNGEREFRGGRLVPGIVPWVPGISPREDGERLFAALFGDPLLRAAWTESRGQSPARRTRLRIDPEAPELHAVPWELLCESTPGEPPRALAAAPETPFSRYLAGASKPGRPVRERPLRLLVAIANPDDLAERGLEPLDTAAERQTLEEAFAEAGTPDLKVTFLEGPLTLPALEEALRQGAHMLHLVAHGRFDEGSGRTVLFLADADNRLVLTRGEEFAEMLARQGGDPRLVFLASCQSAARSPADAFRGLAPQLVAAGTPAVLAMQDLVPIDTARAFAGTFYRRLLHHGLVDLAANEARSALLAGKLPGAAVPVLFLRLKNARLFGPRKRPEKADAPARATRSIAVLPFTDMSPQKDQDFFCDGMAEELINALVNVGGLRVAARTSSFAFRRKKPDIRGIGRKLNVGVVLEGSVRKDGDRLRITAQLVNVADGFPLWAERYDRRLDDVFALQDELTLALVEKLKGELLGGERAAVVKRYTENPAAYRLYLKGLSFWNQRFEGGLRKGLEYFQQAIELEPQYALAHSGLADCYNLLGWMAYLPPRATFPKAKEAARRALAIEENLAEAHISLGFAKLAYDYDWLDAEKEFRRGIELKPSYPTGHGWYSFFLCAQGRSQESLEEIQEAGALDPLSRSINAAAGLMHYFAGHYDQTIDECREALDIDPSFGLAHVFLGLAYEQKEMYEEAIAEWIQAKDSLLLPSHDLFLAHAYAMSGREEKARWLLHEVREASAESYVSSYLTATVHAALDDKDRAFECLERAYEERDAWQIYLNVDPRFGRLRSESRFSAMLEKIGLKE